LKREVWGVGSEVKILGAFFAIAKNRAFRSNSSALLRKPCGISASIPGAWAADRFALPTRGFAHDLLVRPFKKIATSPWRSPGAFRCNPGHMGGQRLQAVSSIKMRQNRYSAGEENHCPTRRRREAQTFDRNF
jgi:hypothetical protein